MTTRANAGNVVDLDVLVRNIAEKDLLAYVRSAAKQAGWIIYHTLNSMGSEPGFPDLTMVTLGRTVFMELKKEGLKPTAHQVRWLDELTNAGAEVYLVYPSDVRRGDVEQILDHPCPEACCRWEVG